MSSRKRARSIRQTAARRRQSSYLAAATKDLDGVQPVVVVDVHMRFGSMVMFMIKWALAAIPALIILMLLGAAISTGYTAFTTYLSFKSASQKSTAKSASQESVAMPRLSVPVDPSGIYSVVSKTTTLAASRITIRLQRGQEVSYTAYHVVCYDGSAGILGRGATQQAAEAGDAGEYSNVQQGTAEFYIAQQACEGVPETVPLLKK